MVRVIVFKPLSTLFQLYCGSQFYWWRKPGNRANVRMLQVKIHTNVMHGFRVYVVYYHF